MTDPNENKRNISNFAKYSAISFQMLATIGLFAFIGYKIDERRVGKAPLFTAGFSLLGVAVAMYQVVKQLNKNKD
ncbi:AtpZ/AtpI family protein [Pedobacter sp. GR22-6]|uniref:AtpZ/AtpI family protein n=1 Tax=Pedobacter sp. GR22-6 TaxID=3127957 RepID=UPI00307DECDF